MKYLGVVSMGHDASVALVDGDQILFAAHAERYSGVKNDSSINQKLLDDCFQYGEPDEIVWYEKPFNKMTRQLVSGQWSALNTQSIKRHLKSFGLNQKINYVDHHESHAAGGFYTSGFEHASILVCDAIGEWQTISIWAADTQGLKCIKSIQYPNSLGLLYSAFTQRVGLKPNEEEYILMGMSAFGDPSRFEQYILNDFVVPIPSPDFKLKVNVHKGISWWKPELTSEQDFMDIAAGIQKVTSDWLVGTVAWMARHLPSNNLILSGGVALNCLSNSHIANSAPFNKIWIMPNPGDAGSSLGAIAAHTKIHLDWKNPYLGYDIKRSVDVTAIVDALVNQEVVGLANGRAEFGPRSLGNRALLADPRALVTKDRVNEIKQRQKFRPFAPVVLQQHAKTWFSMPYRSSPYMQFTAECLLPSLVPAVCHVDNTSRVQTLTKEANPLFHEILSEFYQRTGCPILLNTSLNIKGQPLVNTWDDACKFQEQYGIRVF